jgi:hypothetical protein
LKTIKSGITVDNFCTLYSSAVKHNNQEFEDICYEFGVNQFNTICETNAFLDMDIESNQRLITRAAKNKRFKTE